MCLQSVMASDPKISVFWRENVTTGICIVTATFPPGYLVPDGEQAEMVITTDVQDSPPIRIPIYVHSGPDLSDEGWINAAQDLIGKPAPVLTIDQLRGGGLVIGEPSGKVTALVFSAHYCGHCDLHMPIIHQLQQAYADRDVQFVSVSADSGNGEANRQAMQRWGLAPTGHTRIEPTDASLLDPPAADMSSYALPWIFAMDRAFLAARTYGVKAFPVVFLLNREGVVEAVHGRTSNAPKHNGLDNLEAEIGAELDVLLAGGTRADFAPKAEPQHSNPATRPALNATRPAEQDWGVAH